MSDWKNKLHEYASCKIRPRSGKQRANIVTIYSELIRLLCWLIKQTVTSTDGDHKINNERDSKWSEEKRSTLHLTINTGFCKKDLRGPVKRPQA